MPIQQTDLRIRRTKKLLNTAFTELLDEVALDKITVNNLTKRAEINRVTFYLHYKDIDDFTNQFIDELFYDIEKIFNRHYEAEFSKDVEMQVITQLLDYIASEQKIFRSLLVSKSVPYFTQLFMELIRDLIERRNQDQLEPNTLFSIINIELDVAYWYICSALIGTISMWLANDLKYSPQFLAQQILTLNPLRKYIK